MCPTYSEAKQTEMSAFGAEKGLSQGPCTENGWFMLGRPELPSGFQGRVVLFCFVLFWLHRLAYRILVPQPGTEPRPQQ